MCITKGKAIKLLNGAKKFFLPFCVLKNNKYFISC
jgi:hypothetical protein